MTQQHSDPVIDYIDVESTESEASGADQTEVEASDTEFRDNELTDTEFRDNEPTDNELADNEPTATHHGEPDHGGARHDEAHHGDGVAGAAEVDGLAEDAPEINWRELQEQFVDDPAAAVKVAAELVEQAVAETRPTGTGTSSTEDLRQAFRRYRDIHALLTRAG